MTRLARIPREILKARRKPNPRRQVEHRKFVAAIGICLGCACDQCRGEDETNDG